MFAHDKEQPKHEDAAAKKVKDLDLTALTPIVVNLVAKTHGACSPEYVAIQELITEQQPTSEVKSK